jgi:hypothetical protein
MVPEAEVFRSQLEFLFRDPAMAALMDAAPAALGRSLCWTLGLPPPPPQREPHDAPAPVVPAHAHGPPHPT